MAETNRNTGRRAPARGDVTALQQQALDEDRDRQREEDARAKAERAAVEEYAKAHEVIDYSGADEPLPEPEPVDDHDEPYREIIVKYDVEKMAFGREIVKDPEYNEHGELTRDAVLGNIRFLNFKEGRRYRVPRALADHMDERGLVWH